MLLTQRVHCGFQGDSHWTVRLNPIDFLFQPFKVAGGHNADASPELVHHRKKWAWESFCFHFFDNPGCPRVAEMPAPAAEPV